jgi:hypothetical protein
MKCVECNQEIDGFGKKFCSNSCSNTYNNRGVRRHGNPCIEKCIVCNEPTKTKNSYVKCCSRTCHQINLRNEYIKRWKCGLESGLTGKVKSVSRFIRTYLFEINNNSCQKCGWNKRNNKTNKPPLQIHHKDGMFLNNKPDNLELLCPNCHSLTETFGGLNKSGHGRRKNNCM